MDWQVKHPQLIKNLADLKQVLFSNRQIADPENFLSPPHPKNLKLKNLNINLKQINKAINLIKKNYQKNILIFGDYDADGVCATAILWKTLYKLGFNIKPFLPDRFKHGYGLSLKAIKEIIAQNKPDLIITVDNGIVADQEIKFIKQNNINIIITDHHAPEKKLPSADAIVHSTQLCGASVAWILAREILKNMRGQTAHGQRDTLSLLDLAAIATIADQVPLLGANRSFAFHGLKALQKTSNTGLLELFKLINLNKKNIKEYDINFVIAPRINAAGRLGDATDTLRLLCTQNKTQARQLAFKLNQLNQNRQDITYQALDNARKNINNKNKIIITHSDSYHPGVIGLIAGKLSEEFYQPSIAISVGEKISKASARSVAKINITDFLRQIKSDLISLGGHPMAAGFSLETAKLDLIINKLLNLSQKINKKNLIKNLYLEAILDFNLINYDLVDLVDNLAPFGPKNRQPIFGFKNLKILDAFAMGADKNHLKLKIAKTGHRPINCVGWGMGNKLADLDSKRLINIAGQVEINHYRQKNYLQIKIKDITFPS